MLPHEVTMDFISELFGNTPSEMLFISLAVLFGSILRGASSFGFSMTMIIVMTMFMEPAKATSYILLWEVLASIVHLPFVWRDVQWRTIKWLLVGTVLGTPLGVVLLVIIPAASMTIIINVTVIFLSIIMLRGYHLSRQLKSTEIVGTGIVSGIINGASANGGPPVILMFFSSPAGLAVGRASIIAFFLFTDLWASMLFVQQGFTTLKTLWGALALTPLLVFGIWVGTCFYGKIEENKFKKIAILLLIILSIISCVRAIINS